MKSLLALLEENGIHSTLQLADALGCSVEMVEAKLERYEQLGYVKKTVFSANCSGKCKKCHGCDGFQNSHSTVVYWERKQQL